MQFKILQKLQIFAISVTRYFNRLKTVFTLASWLTALTKKLQNLKEITTIAIFRTAFSEVT